MKLLFVCANNFCLSPLAAGLCKKLAAEQGVADKLWIDSAGTHPGLEQRSAERRTQEIAQKHGIDISQHRTRQVTADDLRNNDLVLAMCEPEFWYVKAFDEKASNKKLYMLLVEYAGNLSLRDFPDPVLGESGFDECFELMEDVLKKLLERVVRRL